MSDRFPDATLSLSLLPAPAVIKDLDYEAIRAARIADFVARMRAKGIAYDVDVLETDPAVILQEEGAFRELENAGAINDAARAVMILYAQDGDQDQLYALLGVRRLVLAPADTTTVPPTAAVKEDNESFRARAQIALEGTAPGLTGGGYAHVALRASSDVRRVALIRGTGGEVNVVLQGRTNGLGAIATTVAGNGDVTMVWTADQATANNDGSVSATSVQAVAAALNDDWSDDAATGSQLTDIPLVRSATVLACDIVARAIVPQGPSRADVASQSLNALIAAAAVLQSVGQVIPIDALIAAGRLPAMSKFYVDQPAADFGGVSDAVPFVRSISVTVSRA